MKKSERTQQRILGEAAQLFNRKGYAGTHIRDIMEATGLAKGGIYGNFQSKEEIELAAFEHAVKLVSGAIEQEIRHIESPLATLHAMFDFYERYVFSPPVEGGCPILNSAIEADDTSPALQARVVAALQRWERRIVRVVHQGIRRQEISAEVNAEEFAVLAIAIIEGGIMLARIYRDPNKLRIPLQHLRDLVDTTLRAK